MTSNIFGVAPCTLSLIIKQVCQTIVKVLASKMIRFPTSENELRELMTRFENKFGFPQVKGCVDGTHIPVKQPTESPHDYFSYKMKYFFFFYIPIKLYSKQTKVTRRCHEEHGNT